MSKEQEILIKLQDIEKSIEGLGQFLEDQIYPLRTELEEIKINSRELKKITHQLNRLK